MDLHDALGTLDTKTRRRLKDQRRMRFRRAIESYEEQCRLQAAVADFPDLLSLTPPAGHRQSGRPGHGCADAARG